MTDRRTSEYYQYNYLLPEPIARAVGNVVVAFAEEHSLDYDLWYHDLPVWVVSGRSNHRINKVQIDAVITAHGSLLSFTPDAFEDTVEVRAGVMITTRRLPSPDTIIVERSSLSVDSLLYRDTRGAYLLEIEYKIRDRVTATWKRAYALELSERSSWERPMPLSS